MTRRKKNKKYQSNKLIIVLSIVFAALLFSAAISAYLIFGGDNSRNTATPDNVVETKPGFTQASENDTAEILKPYKAVETETGKDVPLTTVYGKAYSQYGGKLTLNKDGTFSIFVGISNNDDNSGEYTEKDGVIYAVYKSGKTAEFRRNTAEDGTSEIIVQNGIYEIYFH